ncbi:hypothetical protein ACHAWT_003432 [Skeletonema menzelii]
MPKILEHVIALFTTYCDKIGPSKSVNAESHVLHYRSSSMPQSLLIMSMNGAKAREVITIDSSDDEGEQVAAAASSGHKKSPNSSTVSAKKQSQEVIALLDDSSDDDDENPVPKMDRKRKARPCIEDEIIEMESSVNLSMARKPAARKRAAPKNSSVDNNSPVIPFYLFETTSAKPPSAIPNKNRKYFQTLREAIGLDVPNRQIQWLIISNFLVDFRYVYEKLPDVVQIPRVVVFYGSYFGGMDFHQGLMQELIMKNWKAAAERNGNTVDFIRLVPGDPPKSKTNPLPVKITYGCHHTKLFLTGFDDQVSSEGGRGSTRQSMIRVVVHTANLGASDVEYQTNGFYAQNFPLKKKTVEQRSSIVNPYKIATKGGGVDSTSAAAKSTCSFENDLAEYLESYNYNTLQSWCAPTLGGSMDIREARLKRFGQGSSSTAYPLQQAVNTKDTSRILTSQELSLADLIRQYDYSSAYAVLIPSVPGYHTGMAIKKYGYLKLRQEIIDLFPSSQSLGEKKKKKPPMVCQISSLGSLSEKWLRKFCSALDYTSTHHTNPLDDNCMSTKPFQSLVKIIWPTTDEIRNSVEGVEGGGSVPGRESNLQKSFLKPLYHRWSKRDSRKDPFLTARHVPHIKTIVQPSPSFGNDRSIEWLLLSSHNLSKAAWGQVQNNKRSGGKDCFISHWELGVMFSPATLLEVCGMTKPVRILPIGYDAAQVNGTISLCDDGDDDDGSSDFINVRVPLPYDVHMPDAYDGRDEYWTVN